ncbi:hypothetical protein HMPREF0201_02601 [Cedecea davisae DSM 4568]|uniref:Uncharacterized protein n=1 Tax=Cedecea davisae DSM 4568 TaxID=566551 RepID=S3IUI7_9ENTR|nr:hypothetical protein HMPREF0201_02601 [Cedecea davisae DSM 4568]
MLNGQQINIAFFGDIKLMPLRAAIAVRAVGKHGMTKRAKPGHKKLRRQ